MCLCACHGLHASTRGHSILYIVRDLIAHIRQFKQFLLDNLIFGLVRLLSIFLGTPSSRVPSIKGVPFGCRSGSRSNAV